MESFKLNRLRSKPGIRDLVGETDLSMKNLVLPCFVSGESSLQGPVSSMPGINIFSPEGVLRYISRVKGLRAVLLFGVTSSRDSRGSYALSPKGAVQQTVKTLRQECPEITVITDICLCGYTGHGHCGVVNDGYIDNRETVRVLAEIALSHSEAGADIVAPSAMADGQVFEIRNELDKNGRGNTAIMAYSAKYASAFYGPFRDAVHSSPKFGDRSSYQLDFRNRKEALREIAQDIKEGADIVMVKPALSYLDVILAAGQKFNIPLAAYNVSGEYSMIKKSGSKEEVRRLALEVLTSIRRAGADIIISYLTGEVSRWLH